MNNSVREKYLLNLFHAMAESAPAYKDFLKKNKVNPNKIKSLADLGNLPVTSRLNYLKRYPLEKLCFGGSLATKASVFTSTSGSTGKPFYFPRNELIDDQSSVWHELFLNTISEKKTSTLVIDCFGMGVWIGGLITYQAWRNVALRGYPVSIITPGTNKQEILKSLENIAPKFGQVILCGYPPFIKDIIDESKSFGLNIENLNIKFLFAAEGFSEKFRDYIASVAGIKNIFNEITNIYGSADLGTMAMETPISVLVRRLALDDKKLFVSIFSNISKLPTLAQFNPCFTNFDSLNGEILCSGSNVLPLFRYSIGDRGGVVLFEDMIRKFKNFGINLLKEAKSSGIKNILQLPFVYVYERFDFSTKLYGAIIYPEHLKDALLHESISGTLTGKFVLETVSDKKYGQFLQVHIELKPGRSGGKEVAKKVCKLIVESLLEKNAEYANVYLTTPSRARPRVVFWPYEHPFHFKKDGKQKWVKK